MQAAASRAALGGPEDDDIGEPELGGDIGQAGA